MTFLLFCLGQFLSPIAVILGTCIYLNMASKMQSYIFDLNLYFMVPYFG